jgi:hypothetical protein
MGINFERYHRASNILRINFDFPDLSSEVFKEKINKLIYQAFGSESEISWLNNKQVEIITVQYINTDILNKIIEEINNPTKNIGYQHSYAQDCIGYQG